MAPAAVFTTTRPLTVAAAGENDIAFFPSSGSAGPVDQVRVATSKTSVAFPSAPRPPMT